MCNKPGLQLLSSQSHIHLMESIVKDHLMSYLLESNLLSDFQFEFIPGRSCTTQLLHILDYVT